MEINNWAGVWMDQSNSFVCIKRNGHWDTRMVMSDLELAPHRSAIYDDMMAAYLHNVCKHLQDATSILVMGPGDSKNNLCDSLTFEDSSVLQPEIVVEEAGEMTEREVKAKIMRHFGHPAIHIDRVHRGSADTSTAFNL